MPERLRARSDGADTRARMIDTALDLIARHGYEGMSLQMIADAIGVTKAAVYYHFKTKSDLLDATLQLMLADAPTPPNPRVVRTRRARLTWLAEEFLAGLTKERRMISVISSDPVIRRHPTFVLRVEGTREKMLRTVYGDSPTPSERAAYYLATSAVHALPYLENLSDEALIQALRPVIYRTLGLPPPPDEP